ncbi:sn-glycerol-3-phosphate ABC transporter permease UgpA [Rhodobacter sphaeroides]|jgi:carbohydrate ABC transporter membrane protein 1, CUT1 family (TC 3.A.1.1.-)|uniref:sn-glycerol-3-phosphate transport system permease protein UgpA n=1 Tax=Cereibacter sphaeroides (strain ATCC 17023 / DSM 158 / JCM 6121 / CCUG 31486 / LMG 2827 / NBRC 12203 / NCIMB 8253 / ATH 2.4.1.) TaxID=272943 RepID=Q3IX38_CERS4|nr:sn-glycerol-3-phosphate ABC transporter permease UgpA [Cereibacter sphaeroides]ABA80896.1 carbohydrate ABC transporter membrane protein 1, CUT1 family [Cereibacter sphaeroides 2.4.1]AMJ49217.1 glycerol-3-phosphate transporter permease [Cereibacter sphaeroides]ANS35923.1 glycerol-3-phosphate transporter permease [Cereibacter sphaeroides]ATN64987.1 glycerol-3-phosphate transporter permease [Cereibacter sphaeroides]AXC63185.1 sn-glycerol-3-phosphate ABC transporter permease UgpA [Cereibacter s
MHRAHFPHRLLPWLLVAPQLLISAVFFYWPAGQALWQSTLREDAFGLKSTFVGFANFRRVLSDPAWLNSIQVTAVFSLLTAFFSMAIALFLAVQAEKVVRGRGFYRTLMIWPYAVAPAIAGMLWLFMFNPSFGTLAWPLRQLGIRWDPLLDGEQAMALVVAAASWKQISYNFLFFVAGLQAIPRSLLEAAAIDGATARRRFWTITFPLLAPTTFFLLVVNSVYALFDTFGIIHAVTGGGPGKSTETLVYKVYNDGFVNLRFGDSAAQSVILMVIVIALTAFQFKYIERKVHYG